MWRIKEARRLLREAQEEGGSRTHVLHAVNHLIKWLVADAEGEQEDDQAEQEPDTAA